MATTSGPLTVVLVGDDQWQRELTTTLTGGGDDTDVDTLGTDVEILEGDPASLTRVTSNSEFPPRTVDETDANGLETIGPDTITCLLCDDTVSEDRGVSFVEACRERYPTLPLVFVPRAGDERLAGAVTSAGATAYVPFDDREEYLWERLESTLEHTQRERDLRRSEELHRFTLNHMTDTVLLTDSDGEFTYVCPNVNFIFGYTVAEIHEMGTIDTLLGEGWYDETELEREGVLTNLECTATDKAGTEHELLVNVREVSIQEGTTLYSCRDVTTRKQRERALSALHETTRDLLYAESSHEIAHRIVDDATEILDLPAAAIYRFEENTNVLEPTAYTQPMAAIEGLGRLESKWPGDGSVVSTAFLSNEARSFDDLSRFQEPAGQVRSAVVIPLGDHGVFVVGDEEPHAIDEVTRDLADLLAATAEAALDRVERESALRARDRELKRQNRRLTDLDRINEIIREIGQDVVRADTRAEIEQRVCERLTGDGRFAFAWIGQQGPHETGVPRLRPRMWAGDRETYLDALGTEDAETVEPTAETLESGQPTVVENVAERLHDESWRSVALARGLQSAVSVPLAYDDVGYGALTVYADQPNAFDDTSRAVLEELGETIAAAIGAVERKHALLSNRVVELTYDLPPGDGVFGRLAHRANCLIELEGGFQRVGDGVLAFATVTGTDLTTVVDLANASIAVDDATAVSERADGGLLRVHLSRPSIATRLVEHGATVGQLVADSDGVTLTVDVPAPVETGTVDDVVRASYPDASLRSQRDRGGDGAPTTRDRLADDVSSRLTDRQLEVVRTAYHAGFFESPREHDGEAVAATLDISSTAFYDHVRAVQRTLFETIFDDVSRRG